MRLSNLQKNILRQVWGSKKPKVQRGSFLSFYKKEQKIPNKILQTKIITKSLERLIEKGLLTGFGERTQYKWFIKEVKFTPQGKREAIKLLGVQTTLPFKKRSIK